MTQKNNKIFINEIYSKLPKNNYATNKTDVYHIDDIWSLDILDIKDYSPENKRGYRYVFVIKTISVNLVLQFLSKIKILKQSKTLSKTFL